MSSMFIQGKDEKEQTCFFFIEQGRFEKIIYSVQLTEISRGQFFISNPRPVIPEGITGEEAYRECERLSPRILVKGEGKNKEKIIDLNSFIPFGRISILECGNNY